MMRKFTLSAQPANTTKKKEDRLLPTKIILNRYPIPSQNTTFIIAPDRQKLWLLNKIIMSCFVMDRERMNKEKKGSSVSYLQPKLSFLPSNQPPLIPPILNSVDDDNRHRSTCFSSRQKQVVVACCCSPAAAVVAVNLPCPFSRLLRQSDNISPAIQHRKIMIFAPPNPEFSVAKNYVYFPQQD